MQKDAHCLTDLCETLNSLTHDGGRTPDNRQFAISLPKAEYGAMWQRLFRGDSDGVRCLQPLCVITGRQEVPIKQKSAVLLHDNVQVWHFLTTCILSHLNAETDSEVMLEFELPFWIEEEDVDVRITDTGLTICVQNELSFQRTYWRNRWVVPEPVLACRKLCSPRHLNTYRIS